MRNVTLVISEKKERIVKIDRHEDYKIINV